MFEPGKSGNPNGRPKGTRTVAINIIFRAFSECGAKKFEQEMRKLASQDPVAFYLKYIQPIQPKEIDLGVNEDSTIEISIKPAKKNEG
jgi:hypothetical protein